MTSNPAPARTNDETQIRQLMEDWRSALANRDLDKLALVVWTANDQEREVMGRQNPELHFTPVAALLLTLAAILIAFVVHVSPLFQRQLPASTESK